MTQTVTPISLPSLFNPGLQDDDSLVAGFVARQDLLDFFVSELRAVPMQGTVQHHLVIGARGMGKTTLLKRLAIAIRQDSELSSHLIPLTFPEEQYNVKDLADLWLNAMDALGDELEGSGRKEEAHELDDAIAHLEGEGLARDTLARRARALLVERCSPVQTVWWSPVPAIRIPVSSAPACTPTALPSSPSSMAITPPATPFRSIFSAGMRSGCKGVDEE